MSEVIEGEIVSPEKKVRLTKYDENTVKALETAFHNAYNITEACQHAGISRDTFYRWLAEDDNFSYRMSLAQTALNRKAKANVFTAIEQGDPAISLKYLTLRDPDFKPKGSLEIEPGEQRAEQKLKEFMDDTDDGAYDLPTGTDVGGSEHPATPESDS